jgi:hypothetical protein
MVRVSTKNNTLDVECCYYARRVCYVNLAKMSGHTLKGRPTFTGVFWIWLLKVNKARRY